MYRLFLVHVPIEPLEGTEVNVIEPRYSQEDLERAYRQGYRAGAHDLRAQAQRALGALGDAVVSSADTAPIPSNLRATVARMARVGQRTMPIRPDQRLPGLEEQQQPKQPHVSPSPYARPFPGNGLQEEIREVRPEMHERVQTWPSVRRTPSPGKAVENMERDWAPRPGLSIVPDPTRLDLNVPQQEHGEKKLPRR